LSDLGLSHVALPVVDLERSIGFYAKYAAMDVVHRREDAVWLSDKTRPFVIVLVVVEEVTAPLAPMAHLGVGCESRAQVERLAEVARAEDALIGGPSDAGPPVGYWALLRDPDGHTLELSHGQEVGLAVERARSAGSSRD